VEYRNLGRSGLQVSAIGLGCNNFGGRCDATQTAAVVHAALDLGVTLVDTADVYGGRGKSEEFLGAALKGRRHAVVLATKFASPMGDGPMQSGASRAYILRAVEASLRRLDTDYVDLYQQHRFDPVTPVEETLHALDDLVRSGKVRYIGNSNFKGWHIASAHWIAQTQHLTSFISAQNEYSLLNRKVEEEIAPASRAFGLGILPYSPLGSGMLTGKYVRHEPGPAGARLSEPGRGSARWLTDRNYELVEKLRAFAQGAGHTPLELAIAWLAAQPHVGSVIAGATTPDQVRQNVAAGAWVLGQAELATVDELTKA